jgi:hypothetical protein
VKFSFSSEQEEFRSNLRRFLADRSPTKEVRRLMETDDPKSGSWLGCPLCDAGWDNRGLRFRRG